METFAPGTAAPDWSVTFPESVAPDTCAQIREVREKKVQTKKITNTNTLTALGEPLI
jgi:hypothetical protein